MSDRWSSLRNKLFEALDLGFALSADCVTALPLAILNERPSSALPKSAQVFDFKAK